MKGRHCLFCVSLLLAVAGIAHAQSRPNILWLSAEDISAHFGCYGDRHAITPNIDKLAEEGLRYTHTFTTAGVCAPCRSGIITGLYQTTLGTHHMRCTATLPESIKPFPYYMRKAGYFCTNNSKQDYQFKTPKDTWDESSGKAHWRMRPDKDQPFFAVFNYTGCHESGIASESKYNSVTKDLSIEKRQDPKKLKLPPYFPDTPAVREDWKRNYEPLKAYYQYMNTPENGSTMKELRRLHKEGKLPPDAERLFSPVKPVEELYDYIADPHNLKNLADDKAHAQTLTRLRKAHLQWVQETRDIGLIPEPIIAERVKRYGSEYAILRQDDSAAYNQKLGAVAAAASEGPTALPALIEAAGDADSAIRYWAATGIGNIGPQAAATAERTVAGMLKDASSAVRTAAARALCRMDKPGEALPVLIHEMKHGTQWERLHAAIVLDEIDEMARPVIEEMKEGLRYQKGFNSDGKYRVRVMNRALNELNGTSNAVQ